jgi:hypothetical protein
MHNEVVAKKPYRLYGSEKKSWNVPTSNWVNRIDASYFGCMDKLHHIILNRKFNLSFVTFCCGIGMPIPPSSIVPCSKALEKFLLSSNAAQHIWVMIE